MISPPRLQPGARVAIVAPASPVPRAELIAGAAILGARYRLVHDERIFARTGFLAGSDEERAAELLARGSRLKAVAFISGRTAPEGKRMGHAGAIISGNRGTAKSKEEAFQNAGVAVAETTDDIVGMLT